MLLVIGVALLVLAVLVAPLAFVAVRRWRLQRGITRLRPAALATRAGQRMSVAGVAAPGPEGPIESGLAGIECVWHGHEVLRHYRPLARDVSEGAVREQACDSIADYGSEELFGLVVPGRSAGGDRLFIDPRDAESVNADMCLQRVVGRPQPGVAAQADDLLPRVRGRISGVFRGETLEFEYREWVIRPGDRIRVHGTLEVRGGRTVLTAPQDGRLRIEHGVGDEPQRTPPRGADALVLSVALAVLAVAGLVLVLVSL